MLFNSLEYLIFFPLVFTAYWMLSKYLRTQNAFLLVASYFFYGLWDYRFLSLIIISSLVDFLIGLQLDKSDKQSRRKSLVCLSLVINLGSLLVFKYYNFFVDSFVDFSSMIGFKANLKSLNVIIPVGISFYTFQTLSYSIDIYRRNIKPTYNVLNFFTYVAFFPQLIAGPIERASYLLPQIEKNRHFKYSQGLDGFRQIIWGLFKKVVIADNCSLFVDTIFDHYLELSGPILVLGAFFFAFQIYCDFSGYSDIAIGTARLLGINLKQNFATPYFSRNIGEFWRRWHISLTTWFRDYLYIPLGGSRVSDIKQIRNIFIIFIVSGFWHGANWTFIYWGIIHACCYIPLVYLKTNRNYLDTVAADSFWPGFKELLQICITFLITSVAWVFFRADTVTDSFIYMKRIFIGMDHNLDLPVKDFHRWNMVFVLAYILIMLIVEWTNRRYKHGLEKMPNFFLWRLMIYIGLCLFIINFFFAQKSFIYFQF